jgi:hypothetical protein
MGLEGGNVRRLAGRRGLLSDVEKRQRAAALQDAARGSDAVEGSVVARGPPFVPPLQGSMVF